MSTQLGKKLLVHIGALASIVIVSGALWVMYKTLNTISFSDVLHNLGSLSFASVLLGVVITVLSYFTVTGYDVVALDHIKRQVPYPRAALSAFLASTFGNNIGFAVLTGTSIRYRIYSHAGLSALEIAGVSSMCALTTVLGMSVIFSVSMLLQTDSGAQSGIPIPADLLQLAGGLVLTVIVSYLIYSSFKPVTLRIDNWSLRMPVAKTAMAQILLATTNLTLVATLIYVLLPDDTNTSYVAFLAVFALALIAGSASNVPGGIGVFESVILIGLPDIPPAALLGSILLFRCIYYLTPLAIASALLVYHETSRQQRRVEKIQESTLDVLDEIGPQLMSLIILLAGVILLFSGSIPTGFDRTASPTNIPLLFVELSHLLGAAAGTGLLISARGISQRLTSAFDLTVKLLILGIVTSLLKGFGYREALVLGAMLAVLWYTRPEFHRKATILDEGFPVDWVSLVAVIIAVTIWLGLFSFKEIPYTTSLWWTFGYDDDYSRFLRSLLVVFGMGGVLAYVILVRPDPVPELPESKVLDQVRQILKTESSLRANLVFLGDKRILFSHSGNAFIMYQIQGKSWVVLGDPIGPSEEHTGLMWTFRRLCERYGAYPVFYLVDESQLPHFQQMNLSIEKIGDDAVMPLENFSLSGTSRAELKDLYKQVKKQGIRLEILEGDKQAAIIPELKKVSDAWLESTQTHEMGFSRGFFDPYYIVNFPCIVARRKGRIVAFAVVWFTPGKEALALDLMRHHPDAPENIMDYLIIESMLIGKKRGYNGFNLGIAPLPGLENHPLAPLWHKIGTLMDRQGQSTHDIESLRQRDEKYNPVWRPKYLAHPGGIKIHSILRDIARLISQKNVHRRIQQ